MSQGVMKEARKGFLGGCFGCFGVIAAVVVVGIILIVVVAVAVSGGGGKTEVGQSGKGATPQAIGAMQKVGDAEVTCERGA